MTRFLAGLMLAVSIFAAEPAPAHAQQTLGVLSAANGVNLAGTRWQGIASWLDGETKFWTLHFRPDGVLEYAYEGQNYDNGRWTQNDQLITFHTNAYFALYAGRVTGQALSGTMYNRRGANGVFSFVPQ